MVTKAQEGGTVGILKKKTRNSLKRGVARGLEGGSRETTREAKLSLRKEGLDQGKGKRLTEVRKKGVNDQRGSE